MSCRCASPFPGRHEAGVGRRWRHRRRDPHRRDAAPRSVVAHGRHESAVNRLRPASVLLLAASVVTAGCAPPCSR